MFSIGHTIIALLAALGVFVAWLTHHDTKVASKQTAKIERATDNAISKGKRAAANSAAPGVRGERDPTTRND